MLVDLSDLNSARQNLFVKPAGCHRTEVQRRQLRDGERLLKDEALREAQLEDMTLYHS